MKKSTRIFLLSCALIITLFNPPQLFSQSSEGHSVILLGNTARVAPDAPVLKGVESVITASSGKVTLLVLGDILDGNGLGKNFDGTDSLRMIALADLARKHDNADIYFLPGDRDWHNSGKKGLKRVRRLEKLIENDLGLKKAFLPSKGCPGPKVVEIGDDLLLVAINTQWWMHPHEKPSPSDADCKIATPEDFYEELEGIIDESEQKNILVTGHHPVFSSGQYGGQSLLAKHIFPLTAANPSLFIPLPVLGSFYAAYRQNVGTPRDMAYSEYQSFITHMALILADRAPLIYASGHEHNLQAMYIDDNYHLNSGSIGSVRSVGKRPETLYKKATSGFMKINYSGSGKITLETFDAAGSAIDTRDLFKSSCEESSSEAPPNTRLIPCQEEAVFAPNMDPSFAGKSVTTVGGAEYKASGFKSAFLGKHWRDSWTQEVSIPYLNLDTVFNGLKPFAEGGGRQTTSLKFTAGNGKEYVFRSVNKDPYKALSRELRGTVAADVVKDQTTTQHPYGALVVDKLADVAGILHASPKLYVLPKDPKLGPFEEKFGNLFGMLEDRPKKPKGDVEGFKGADDVQRSLKLFRKIYDDNKNKVDPTAFGTARVFDILIGDWGRHRDNWKWAGYKDSDGNMTYYPIPRDRDHTFSRWDGLFPWLADREWAKTNAADFGYTIKGVRSLTWPARHLDRMLGNELDREDWILIARQLRWQMNDSIIDNAVRNLPKEIYPVSGTVIAEKLKSRRWDLEEAVETFYLDLAKYVDIRGSNEKEKFVAHRTPDGNVSVQVYREPQKEGDEPIYERMFYRDETKEIRLFGLGGKDKFLITGNAGKTIKIRVIGGAGQDEVFDDGETNGDKTIVYDSSGKDVISPGDGTYIKSPKEEVDYRYDRFKYNTYFPIPSLAYTPGNGFSVGMNLSWNAHSFDKPDYASKHSVSVAATTIGNLNASWSSRFSQIGGKWDLGFDLRYARPDQQFANFYGVGNETVKNDSLFTADFYRINLTRFQFEPSLTLPFAGKSYLAFGVSYENNNVEDFDNTPGILDTRKFEGVGKTEFAGAFAKLYVDFRDNAVFARKGVEFYLAHQSYRDLRGNSHDFGRTEGYLAWYGTARLGIPVTLALRAGGADIYNDAPFYQLPTLGSASNLRGFFRDRFTGNTVAYGNAELRLEIAEIFTAFLPTRFGIYGFSDIGKAWVDGETSDEQHLGYGGGVFFSPLSESFTLTFEGGFSEEQSLLFRFGFGFFVQ